MHRTTILLPNDLRREAETVATRRGITLSELIRRQLAAAIRTKPVARSEDPLFRPRRLATRKNPSDIAASHDSYLYGPTIGGKTK